MDEPTSEEQAHIYGGVIIAFLPALTLACYKRTRPAAGGAIAGALGGILGVFYIVATAPAQDPTPDTKSDTNPNDE